jgi:uncharacterized membrane protein (UPF0127 family)
MAEVRAVRNLTRGTIVAARVAVGASLWRRFRGLMGRASLERGEGLWLPGTNGIHMLFMRFPIDCAFVGPPDPHGGAAVVGVRRSLPPWRGVVWYVRGAKGVIELPAGALESSGTQVGDTLAFDSLPVGS